MAATSSTLLLDDYLEAGDPRFLDEVLACKQAKKLKSIAARWYGDVRPSMRAALLRYIEDGCDRAHHRPLVKGLFKLAEAAADDDEVMGCFLVAFDRLVRRTLAPVQRYDPATGAYGASFALRSDLTVPDRVGDRDTKALRFSRRTRSYLCRRAFRYFRRLAKADSARYGRAIRAALERYDDAHLQKPEQLLNAWGLLHALHWGSPVLVRDPRGIRVAEGRSLADLAPAPFAPEAWRGCFEAVLTLLRRANSRIVRAFCIALLKREYAEALRSLTAPQIRSLLGSPDAEVQAFAAELLKDARGVENIAIADWIELLRIENPRAIELLCELVARAVAPERLSLAQCVELACAKPAPVAELGLRWAEKKPVTDEAALLTITALSRAVVARVREAGTAWLLRVIGEASFARPEHLRELFDAKLADVRAQAAALAERDPRFRESTVIWAALCESPYDDTRAFLGRHLASCEASLSPDTLRHVWVTALLAVHRGGRAKRIALGQVADRIARRPAEAESLLPLLGISLRSVRAPERRTALAAVTRAALREPALRGAIARLLPELRFDGGEAA